MLIPPLHILLAAASSHHRLCDRHSGGEEQCRRQSSLSVRPGVGIRKRPAVTDPTRDITLLGLLHTAAAAIITQLRPRRSDAILPITKFPPLFFISFRTICSRKVQFKTEPDGDINHRDGPPLISAISMKVRVL